MLIQLPDDLQFLQKPFSWVSYKPSAAGLIRIFAWTGLFLLFFNILAPRIAVDFPSSQAMEQHNLTRMISTRSDPRWVRSDIASFQRDKEISIAWIAGSSIFLPKKEKDADSSYDYLPAYVTEVLDRRHSQKTHVYLYSSAARRALDSYTMALDALEKKPDMLVITLNPFWALNDWAVFYKPNIFNRGAALWPSHQTPLFSSVLLGPGNILWSMAGQHLPLIESSYDYLKASARTVKELTGVSLRKKTSTKPTNNNTCTSTSAQALSSLRPREGGGPVAKTKNTSLKNGSPPARGCRSEEAKENAQIDYKNPLTFWILHNTAMPEDQRNTLTSETGLTKTRAWQKSAMALNAQKRDTNLTKQLLINLLDKIQDSEIPTLIYAAPISHNLEGYDDVMRELKEFQILYQSKQIHFVLDIPPSTEKTLKFKDHLHLEKSGTFPVFLSQKIHDLMKASKI